MTVSPSCIYYITSFKRHYNIAKIYSHTKMHTHCIFSTLKYTLSIFLMLHHCYHCLIHHNTLTTISRTTIFCSPITTRRRLYYVDFQGLELRKLVPRTQKCGTSNYIFPVVQSVVQSFSSQPFFTPTYKN